MPKKNARICGRRVKTQVLSSRVPPVRAGAGAGDLYNLTLTYGVGFYETPRYWVRMDRESFPFVYRAVT